MKDRRRGKSEGLSASWYEGNIAVVEDLRDQGALNEAKQAAIVGIDRGLTARAWAAKPWWRRLGSPWRARELRVYLRDYALPRLEMLRQGIEQDQRQAVQAVAEAALDPPAPPIGPIGPRSRPSPFAERLEAKRRHICTNG